MIPVMQQIVGDGLEGRPIGDCLRACVASIFELPLLDVPHFAELGPGWFQVMLEWLRPMGLVMQTEHWSLRDGPKRWPAGWWIASVESENFPG